LIPHVYINFAVCRVMESYTNLRQEHIVLGAYAPICTHTHVHAHRHACTQKQAYV